MIDRNTVKVSDEVLMGRPNGMKARCRIKRVNDKSCTVVLLEKYGNGRGSKIGHEWRIPWSGLYSLDGSTVKAPEPKPLKFNLFTPGEDVAIMEAIGRIYGNLSPENLACDGERPVTEQRRVYRELTTKLGHLQKALGRQVGEEDWYEWNSQRQDLERRNRNEQAANQ